MTGIVHKVFRQRVNVSIGKGVCWLCGHNSMPRWIARPGRSFVDAPNLTRHERSLSHNHQREDNPEQSAQRRKRNPFGPLLPRHGLRVGGHVDRWMMRHERRCTRGDPKYRPKRKWAGRCGRRPASYGTRARGTRSQQRLTSTMKCKALSPTRWPRTPSRARPNVGDKCFAFADRHA